MAMAVVYANFGGQIVHENRGGVERRYIADTLGSTIALTDSGTAITDTWDYWPYGEVMSRSGTNPTPFTFVGTLGYFKDLLDKLFYVRARHYQPNYGRWLTVDPLWPKEAAFGYVGQNPVRAVDPAGLLMQLIEDDLGRGCRHVDCLTICWRDYTEDVRQCLKKCKRKWYIFPFCMALCLEEARLEFTHCGFCCLATDGNPYPCTEDPDEHLEPGERHSFEP